MKREYATTIAERERQSRLHRRKYWNDPEFRLRTVNRWRVWKGREPYTSVDQIQTQGPRA